MNNKKLLRNIGIVSILAIFIDQAIKKYVCVKLSIVGENQGLIGELLSLYHVSTSISLINLSIKILIGVLILIFARYYLIKNGQSKLFLYGLILFSIGFLGRLFDIFTVGHFENILFSGSVLKTIDPLFINFGFYRTIISFSSIVGYIGMTMAIFSLLFEFKLIKSTLLKK